MKIRTNLFLLSATFVILAATIGFIMFYTCGQINREIEESNRITEIVKSVFELNIITHEYLMHHEKRMQQQWQLKYDSLGKLLEKARAGLEETVKKRTKELQKRVSELERYHDATTARELREEIERLKTHRPLEQKS